jgi:hypothetical protein
MLIFSTCFHQHFTKCWTTFHLFQHFSKKFQLFTENVDSFSIWFYQHFAKMLGTIPFFHLQAIDPPPVAGRRAQRLMARPPRKAMACGCGRDRGFRRRCREVRSSTRLPWRSGRRWARARGDAGRRGEAGELGGDAGRSGVGRCRATTAQPGRPPVNSGRRAGWGSTIEVGSLHQTIFTLVEKNRQGI